MNLPVWRASAIGDVLAVVLGALLPLAFAPFDVWPLAILGLAALFGLWQGQSPRRAAWRGGLFGLGWFGVGIYWVFISLHQYGHAPVAFAVLATLALILAMALYPAIMGYLLVRWAPRGDGLRWLMAAPALWTVLEWVRSWLFSGFPWMAMGYSQISSPLSGFAPYFGVFGVGWAVAMSAGLLLMLFRAQGWRRLSVGLGAGVLWISAWMLAQVVWVEPAGEPLRVSLIQGNISQDRKFEPEELDNTLRRYAEMSAQVTPDSDVIIWPETAIPMFYDDAREFVEQLEAYAHRTGVDYLIGIPTGSWTTRVFQNSVLSLGSSQGFYHKHRLLPFGEYLPLRQLLSFFHNLVDIPLGDFTPGGKRQTLLRVAGQPVGVSICFEAVFGSEIRRTLPDARFLVNVSNDAWFGESLAPYQHLQIAQMRSLESGRYMARATNTGISAFIDSHGRIVKHSPLFQAVALTNPVQPLQGATPYVRWGDRPVVILMALLLGLAGWVGRRGRHSRPTAP
ncbi:MAG: apolipoprotein N-acyltransferase [Gammaproteobacteria bacterium]|nr:apolipoprotein N-acyltransferase [Gammaproteobacteria bacterium]MCP5423829.1 apolipoprotein N-acyltransferase [Gammaproteobacteria bacterium]